MSKKWKKAVRGVEAVQAFDNLDRGGSQKPDPRYDTSGRVAPPSEGPPPSVQQQVLQYGQNASYFNDHPHSTVSSPFVANTTQSSGPFQHYYPSQPPQPLQYSPQCSPPQQYSPRGEDYNYTTNHATYGAQDSNTPTTTNYNVAAQGSPPRMENHNATGHHPREQNRGFDTGSGGSSVDWTSANTLYNQYNQPRTDYLQRSSTMHGGDYQQHHDPAPVPLYRSFTVPNNYDHNCSNHLSQ